MNKSLLFVLALATSIFAQTDWERWGKAETDYSVASSSITNNQSMDTSLLSLLKEGYSFFISDLDGDNCPFYPTCSNFFIQSVSKTNIFQGTLMFADRFTRDSNVFKSHKQYSQYRNGRLYDPIDNYLLNDSLIEIYHENKIINR
jgi:putative component of membrane protein insertase Oxa1/YidC/SpoIIIJ protein YidD